jgi:hypothetical protein
MGEIADILINGEFDSNTGEYIGKPVGYPRTIDRSLPWEKRTDVKPETNDRLAINSKRLLELSKLLDFNIQVMNKGYHLRIIKPGFQMLDFFPTTMKFNWVGTNEYFTNTDLETFIFNNFKNKTQ